MTNVHRHRFVDVFKMLTLSRSSCDGFTEEHTILLVPICEVSEHNSISGTRKISSYTFG